MKAVGRVGVGWRNVWGATPIVTLMGRGRLTFFINTL